MISKFESIECVCEFVIPSYLCSVKLGIFSCIIEQIQYIFNALDFMNNIFVYGDFYTCTRPILGSMW